MFKKVSSLLILFTVLILVGCNGTDAPVTPPTVEKTDIEIVYEVKDELTFDNLEVTDNITLPTSTNTDVTITWTSSNPTYLDIMGIVTRPDFVTGNKSVSLTAVITLNDAVATTSFTFTVLAEEKLCDTCFTDELVMDFSYENTSFISNGIGEVDLVSCVDGDTAIFTEGGQNFSVRFLGINTPESTYKFEPWGKPASEFTCNALENAQTIVLEYDVSTTRTDGNERYLAWVWYDGRLLNLELLEESYTGSKGVGGLKYESIFYSAEFATQPYGLRIWGEDDPTFDYSLDGIQVTIEELVTNQEEYIGLKVVVRGVISRTLEGHPYIQSGGYGIYLFKGYDNTSGLAEGNEVLISGLNLTYYPDSETGALQLTGFSRTNYEVLSTGNVVNPNVVFIDELSRDSIGSLVQMDNLTVISVYANAYDDAFTVTAEDGEGNQITIRRDDAADANLTADLFTEGTVFSVVAPLGRYNGNYQLVLIRLEDVTFNTQN
jgi:micrococcal nuclease